ncbi:MAG: cysteine desulfurase [Candidatus Methanomethylophilaceae archaeon]|nr:cysteine desulfurase [Candidatus Methanomethylophilaceae archaeon]
MKGQIDMIFLDNASTTRLKKEALDAMMPYLTDDYANPSSVHKMARGPRNAVDEARKSIANAINAQKGEIYFTSGGTESDNWVIKNAPKILPDKGKHIIVSSIEHHAIIESARYMESCGYDVTYLKVDGNGLVSLDDLKAAVRDDTVLISVMTANNEIGTIEPITEIGAFAREKGIIFHTDAVQAVGHIPMDVQSMNIDMLSVSGHKFGGPKGIGFLYVRKGLNLPSFMNGGSQENGMRAGTTNVPGIIGMAKALEVSIAEMDSAAEKMIAMREHCIERIEKEIPNCRLNGDRKKRLPGNVNFTFLGIGEGSCGLPMLMNFNDICVSTGSACAASSSEPSHVLLAIGVPREDANGSIRITLSEENTMEEIDKTVDVLKESIDRLRRLGM